MKTRLIFLGLILASCESHPTQLRRDASGANYEITIIDSCEYIVVDQGILDARIYSLTHKGNCSNPIHRRH